MATKVEQQGQEAAQNGNKIEFSARTVTKVTRKTMTHNEISPYIRLPTPNLKEYVTGQQNHAFKF